MLVSSRLQNATYFSAPVQLMKKLQALVVLPKLIVFSLVNIAWSLDAC